MTWYEAFLRQARSENMVRRRLNNSTTEYSHRLHYLQMFTEKIAKAFLTGAAGVHTPRISHNAFVRFLQTLNSHPHLARSIGYEDQTVFREFIKSLLPLARSIEQLAPSQAGLTKPNPEYPWINATTGQIFAPTDYDFPQFAPHNSAMIKLEKLLDDILRVSA